MKLSLMVPTFNNAETIERTLKSVLAQAYRPLEVLVYDEASVDGTRKIVTSLLQRADPSIDARLITARENSGPVMAWRVALHAISGEWCAFVWSDDVLGPNYSETLMAGARRAREAGRAIVACSAYVEQAGRTIPYYAEDSGLASALEYSEGIFLRRFPLTQICAVYDSEAARQVFDRHIRIENPRGYDFARFPYGNDVGFLSELAALGDGVELLGERLVTLVDSSTSMTRSGTREHLWRMRWQYTWNQYRVWTGWVEQGNEQARRLAEMARRRLALCDLLLGGHRWRLNPRAYVDALRAYAEYRRLDYQLTGTSLELHRRKVSANG